MIESVHIWWRWWYIVRWEKTKDRSSLLSSWGSSRQKDLKRWQARIIRKKDRDQWELERRYNQAKAKTIKEDATHGIGKRKKKWPCIYPSRCVKSTWNKRRKKSSWKRSETDSVLKEYRGILYDNPRGKHYFRVVLCNEETRESEKQNKANKTVRGK